MGSTTKKSKAGKTDHFRDYVSWFEIPALHFEQTTAFYNQIFSIDMKITVTKLYCIAFFPAKKGIGGAVVTGEGYLPGSEGPLLYLNGGPDLSEILHRVEPSGGRVILEKTQISPEVGYFALFMDPEGNKLGLHSKH